MSYIFMKIRWSPYICLVTFGSFPFMEALLLPKKVSNVSNMTLGSLKLQNHKNNKKYLISQFCYFYYFTKQILDKKLELQTQYENV